ncbi:hypothetical protein QBC36DRAFT_211193 [Triangularia setosa]|uniref:Uncharacterized protein n=1 Tax=Triangularia setosa TaxID=2587417 RepID=A0AAN6WBL6_9PEZI|nr:hypothetical protein QBC36DRAFT_211193 [Podospora setosa]
MPDAVADTGWFHCKSLEGVDSWDKPALETPAVSPERHQFVVITDSAGIKTVLVCPIASATTIFPSPILCNPNTLMAEKSSVAAGKPMMRRNEQPNYRRLAARSPQQSYEYRSGTTSTYNDDNNRTAPSSSSRSTYAGYQSSPQTGGAADDYISQGQQSTSDTSYSTSNTPSTQQTFRSTSGSSSSGLPVSPSSSSLSQTEGQMSPKAAFISPVHKSSTTGSGKTSSSSTLPPSSDTVSEDPDQNGHRPPTPPAIPLVKPSPADSPPPSPPSQPPPSSTTAPASTPTPTPTNGAAGSGLQLPSIPGITDSNNPGPEAPKPFDVSNLLKIGGSSVLGGGLTLVAIFFLVKYFIRRKNGKQGSEEGGNGGTESKNNDLEAGLGGIMASAGVGQQQLHQQQSAGDDSGNL